MMGNKLSCKDNNKKYTAETLLQDDFFIASRLHPMEETDAYWKDKIKRGLLDEKDYIFACRFIRGAQICPEFIPDADILSLWVNIEVRNKTNMKRKKKQFYIMSVVPGIVALLAIMLLINNYIPDQSNNNSSLFVNNIKLQAGSDIQLYLDGDTPVALRGKEAKIAYEKEDIMINDHEIVLRKESLPDKKNRHHHLVVPWGKRSMLTLLEGSRIWVNAGTQVSYPVDFGEKKREIYVDGEIYLEVSPDKKRPFIVKTTEMDVEVLGTTFNLTAYGKDKTKRVVLLSGSVKVNSAHQKNTTILSPDEMYSLNNGVSEVRTVEASNYVSWKQGLYYYNSESLGAIMEHLSLYYGCAISCTEEVSQIKFSGKLDLHDKLEIILKGISQTAPITYEYNEGVYSITNK